MPFSRRCYLERCGRVGGALGVGVLGGCARNQSSDGNQTTVRIGSKPFPEQKILGYLAYERLQDVGGLTVVDEIGYGNSLANWRATASGEKHLYWEYTGTAWTQLPPRHETRVSDPDRLFERVKSDARSRGLRMADPASFSNEYVIVVDRAWAQQLGISTITELFEYISETSSEIGIALNEEFYHRDDGWDGLLEFYGVDEDVRTALESGEFTVTSVGLTYELLNRNGIQVASGFATDPQLDRPELLAVADDREYFLSYQPTPTAHAPLIESRPEVFEALTPVVDALDETVIRTLNRRVFLEDRPPSIIAKRFLSESGVADV